MEGSDISQPLWWAEEVQRCAHPCISFGFHMSHFDFFQHCLCTALLHLTKKAHFLKCKKKKFFCKFWDKVWPCGHLVSLS